MNNLQSRENNGATEFYSAEAIFDQDFFESAPPTSPGLKYWNGSSWVSVSPKRWNGSAWVAASFKRWNGSTWVTV